MLHIDERIKKHDVVGSEVERSHIIRSPKAKRWMNQYALFDIAMSRAVSDRSRKNLLARFFLVEAETIGRKPDSEMERKRNRAARRGRKHKVFNRAKPDSEMQPQAKSSGHNGIESTRFLRHNKHREETTKP